jgi:hypothetical protein
VRSKRTGWPYRGTIARFAVLLRCSGFTDVNPKEKDVNSMTQTVFYSTEMMARQQHRMEYQFEKECINEMARSTLRSHSFDRRRCIVGEHYTEPWHWAAAADSMIRNFRRQMFVASAQETPGCV